jgi:hypothetical protein
MRDTRLPVTEIAAALDYSESPLRARLPSLVGDLPDQLAHPTHAVLIRNLAPVLLKPGFWVRFRLPQCVARWTVVAKCPLRRLQGTQNADACEASNKRPQGDKLKSTDFC